MSEEKSVLVNEFVLSTGKKIYLREPELDDAETCAQIAGKTTDPKNVVHLGMVMQKEMLKLLLLKVNNQTLKLQDKQNLKALFTVKEYNQALQALKMVSEDGSEGNLQHNHVSFGSN